MEARMRNALFALIFAGASSVAMTTTPDLACAAGAFIAQKGFDLPSAITPIDYRGRHFYRGYGHYRRRPAVYGYYAPRAYYRAPAYYAPPVVYYLPPVVYYPPPVVVYGGYPAAAPYRYYGAPAARYYDRDDD
jgi:hypothetical protein